ncbi:MAG: protease modulator HflC [Lentisphaeria bacterium]|nr:protease modulator HflC [Lentisphaeria bacterium]
MADKRTFMQHWPVMALAAVVVLIFGLRLVTFQVQETEVCIVKRFGESLKTDGNQVRIYTAGLHPKLPYPIESTWIRDRRRNVYELKTGRVEQIQTHDNYQIVVSTFVVWRIGQGEKAALYMQRIDNKERARETLDGLVRNGRNIVLGKHDLSDLINAEKPVQLGRIEQEMLDTVKEQALDEWGIEVIHIGVKHIGFPEKVTPKVFERMIAERERKSTRYLADGQKEADHIRSQAKAEADTILADAETKATLIRSEGDKEAAEYYAVFAENPELAAFLRKLESLRLTLSKKTTLILDTNTPPYDLLRAGAADLEKVVGASKSGGAKK